ncbi:adenylate kinase [Aerococcaceae bacterium NML191292]|nr:adenylate kinase [Aerococcaceae bacterium NML210727]MCW6654428.1 adenylate kinase [Aerococcaceae bacterium NML201296]MCW6659057.1 adenylate kinase [Aerococcaceae bacterium NML191292]MCW6660817.1 adenylate kinase [Aerococcaceae bacterium NML201209]MCW6662390.1 adenylate kinase [Aerococcaceae bacterium NML190073]MCW6664380.1 adenylate kinase [Aerococcaceae bacterium NML191219]MCW6667162.1 adenylate kinase [Aerococcaceae bacterium NML190938]MCW6675607.1 adenylate kinase [Aerococcaceae bacter
MNILLMGLPGAGKGTQSEHLVKDYQIVHIATGDIFREAIKNETPLGLKAKSYTDNGNLVPDEVTNAIVRERLAQDDVKLNGFMLDGYPRTNAQAQALDQNLQELDTQIDAVIYIDVDPEVLKERLSGRIICRNCGATYHKLYNPPKVDNVCDNCGASDFYQREDDKPEKVAYRINLQMESIRPILDYYDQRGLLHKVNGEQSIEEVYREIRMILTQVAK